MGWGASCVLDHPTGGGRGVGRAGGGGSKQLKIPPGGGFGKGV